MTPKQTAVAARRRRHRRVRKKVSGTAQRPRLAVFRSLKHTYAQVIDDTRGHTLTQAATLEPGIRGQVQGKNKSSQAELVGDLVAKRTISQGVKSVLFDRAGYKYHGRVKALAEAARKAGLEF